MILSRKYKVTFFSSESFFDKIPSSKQHIYKISNFSYVSPRNSLQYLFHRRGVYIFYKEIKYSTWWDVLELYQANWRVLLKLKKGHERMVAQLHDRNQTRLQIFKLQMKPQVVPVSDLSLIKVTYQKSLVSADMDPILDRVQAITLVFREPSNHDPHTSLLQTQTRFSTPIICDIEPDIIYPTSRKIFV